MRAKNLKKLVNLECLVRREEKSKTVLGKVDDFLKSAIRSKVHKYFFENEQPTLDKILSDVNSDSELCNPDLGLPEFKRTSFHILLLDIGFAFVKRKAVNVILDRDDIVLWRPKYLRNIREYRRENRKIYYLDETWVNEGHCNPKVWTDCRK